MSLAILNSLRRLSAINLKRMRERSKITQKQVAEYFVANGVQISESTISRWESDPGTATAEDLTLYFEALGYLDIQTPGLELANPFADIYAVRDKLCDLAKSLPQPPIDENVGLSKVPTRPAIVEAIRSSFSRPVINLVGSRDAGKSTFANSLLGKSLLPTGRLAVSKIPTLVRHIGSHHEPGSGRTTYVVSRAESAQAKLGLPFTPVEAGDPELLDAYTHNSTTDTALSTDDIGLIIIYDDASILQNYDILDLPGLGDNSEDTMAARTELEAALDSNTNSLLFLLMPQDYILAGTDKGVLDDWIKKAPHISLIRLVITKCVDPGRPLIDLPRALATFEEKLGWPVSQLSSLAFYQPTPAEWAAKVNTRSWSVGRTKLKTLLEEEAPAIFRERFDYRIKLLKESVIESINVRSKNIAALSKKQEALHAALAKLESETLPAAEKSVRAARDKLPMVSTIAFDTLESNLAILFNSLENPAILQTLIEQRFRLDDDKELASKTCGIVLAEHINKEVQGLVSQAISQIQGALNENYQSMDALGNAIKDFDGLKYIDADSEIRNSAMGLFGVAAFSGVGGVSLMSGAAGIAGLGAVASIVSTIMPPALVVVGIRLLMKLVAESKRDWRARMAEAAALAIKKSSLRASITIHLLSQKPILERKGREALDGITRTNFENLSSLRTLAEDSGRSIVIMERYRVFLDSFTTLPWPKLQST